MCTVVVYLRADQRLCLAASAPTFGTSPATAHRRFTICTEAGLGRRLRRVVLDELGAGRGGLDLGDRRRGLRSRRKGGSLTGPNPVDRLALRLPPPHRPIRTKGLGLPRPGRRPDLLQEARETCHVSQLLSEMCRQVSQCARGRGGCGQRLPRAGGGEPLARRRARSHLRAGSRWRRYRSSLGTCLLPSCGPGSTGCCREPRRGPCVRGPVRSGPVQCRPVPSSSVRSGPERRAFPWALSSKVTPTPVPVDSAAAWLHPPRRQSGDLLMRSCDRFSIERCTIN